MKEPTNSLVFLMVQTIAALFLFSFFDRGLAFLLVLMFLLMELVEIKLILLKKRKI